MQTPLSFLDNVDIFLLSQTCKATSSLICSTHSLKVSSDFTSLPPKFCRPYNHVRGIWQVRQAYHLLGLLPITHFSFSNDYNKQVCAPCGCTAADIALTGQPKAE